MRRLFVCFALAVLCLLCRPAAATTFGIDGYVASYAGGRGADRAIVKIQGPVSGEVETTSYGYFSAFVVAGTYTLTITAPWNGWLYDPVVVTVSEARPVAHLVIRARPPDPPPPVTDPKAPTKLRVVRHGGDWADLTFNDNSTDEEGFGVVMVYKKGSYSSPIQTFSFNQTKIRVEELGRGRYPRTYHLAVVAFIGTVVSPPTNTVTVKVPALKKKKKR